MFIEHQYQYRNSLEPIFLSYRTVATLFQDLDLCRVDTLQYFYSIKTKMIYYNKILIVNHKKMFLLVDKIILKFNQRN
jgi:hypothetical protein